VGVGAFLFLSQRKESRVEGETEGDRGKQRKVQDGGQKIVLSKDECSFYKGVPQKNPRIAG